MKNKLLLTSALISGLSVIGSAAIAETKITGGLTTGYKSGEGIGAGKSSRSGFFRESQINLENSGNLNNGFKYKAGFSFEADGGDTAGDTISNLTLGNSVVKSDEGVFIEFIKGDTTLHFGMDKVQNIDMSPTPRVAENANTALGGYAGSVYNQALTTPKGAFGVAVVQKAFGGNISVNVVPSNSDTGSSDTTLNVNATADSNDGASAYEVVYRGKPIANVPLDIMLGRTVVSNGVVNTPTSQQDDQVTTTAAFGYNFGKFAVGYDRRMNDSVAYAAGFVDQTSEEISATAALSDNVSVGIGQITVDRDKKTSDEEIKYIQVGYNMGPVFTSVGYFDVENGGFISTNDGSLYSIRFGAKF
jgi:hypothetical protein